MIRRSLLVLACAAVLLLGACGGDDDTAGTTTTSANTTTTSGTASETEVSTFSLASDVNCEGTDVEVKAEWTSRRANSAKIEVDGTFVAEDLPANGSTEIRLECTESTHRVVLEVVSSDGKTAAVAHEVRTVPGGGGGEKPTIDSFTVSADGCTGETANVSATYATTGAETVEFEVDGEAPGAQAGLPTSGTENVPDVPCDGATHQITLVATNASDSSVQQTHTVNAPSA